MTIVSVASTVPKSVNAVDDVSERSQLRGQEFCGRFVPSPACDVDPLSEEEHRAEVRHFLSGKTLPVDRDAVQGIPPPNVCRSRPRVQSAHGAAGGLLDHVASVRRGVGWRLECRTERSRRAVAGAATEPRVMSGHGIATRVGWRLPDPFS